MFLLWDMLNQRADRHDKEPAGKPQPREQQHHRIKRQSRNCQAQAETRHAQRAKRNQPVFDLPTGKKPRREAADSNPNGHCRLK